MLLFFSESVGGDFLEGGLKATESKVDEDTNKDNQKPLDKKDGGSDDTPTWVEQVSKDGDLREFAKNYKTISDVVGALQKANKEAESFKRIKDPSKFETVGYDADVETSIAEISAQLGLTQEQHSSLVFRKKKLDEKAENEFNENKEKALEEVGITNDDFDVFGNKLIEKAPRTIKKLAKLELDHSPNLKSYLAFLAKSSSGIGKFIDEAANNANSTKIKSTPQLDSIISNIKKLV